jgi:hypothetical protein
MQNKSLFNSLAIVSLIAFAAASETFPSLNESLQLVPFKDEVTFIINNLVSYKIIDDHGIRFRARMGSGNDNFSLVF